MSAISQKSITGITSITTPAGVDNQFTLHVNDTSEALKLDHAGNIHIHNHVNTTGISSASNFKTGSSNLHSSGLSAASIDVGSNIKLGNAGVITATSFVGDGSDLTNLPAGLGTALSATATSPLNKMYYTNAVLGIAATTTVDVPASASAAYTQYADINIATDADLIIADGDDLIPDVLGLADFGTFGGGTAGRLRVSSISNHTANGAPTVQHGLVVTGVCTATSFAGDGSALTGLSGVSVANQTDNRLITATGTTDALNGESNLTFDGTDLSLTATDGKIKLKDGNSYIQFLNTDKSFKFVNAWGAGEFIFDVNGGERLRIESGGEIRLTSENGNNSDTPGFTFRGGSSSQKANFARIHSRMVSNWGGQLQFKVKNDNGSLSDAYQTAMIMNHNAHVTKPSQPRALVKIYSTTTLGNAKITNWASPTYNVGNLWNAANSRFIAPEDGLYLVGGNFRIGAPGKVRVARFNLQVYNTSNTLLRRYGGGTGGGNNYDGGSTGYDHPYVSFTNIIFLNNGEYVELHTAEVGVENTSYIQTSSSYDHSNIWCVLLQ